MKGSRFSEEQTVIRDHRGPAGAGSRRQDRGGLPAARDLERDLARLSGRFIGHPARAKCSIRRTLAHEGQLS